MSAVGWPIRTSSLVEFRLNGALSRTSRIKELNIMADCSLDGKLLSTRTERLNVRD